jgi:hypothetical protein
MRPAILRKMNPRLSLGIALVILATVMRVLPHPWNLTPIGAVSLFSGACFDRKRWAFTVPLAAMFVSDTLLEVFTGHGYHSLMPVIYATFALIVVLGMILRDRRDSPFAVASGSVASATIFYVVSNFAMWTISTLYPKTVAGLIACYIAAIPFYGTMLLGDLAYSALLFGTFVWAQRRLPQFANAER